MTVSNNSPKSKITSLHSVSHDKDVDGLASAAIVWRYAKEKSLDFSVDLTDYGSFEEAFSRIAALRNTLIVITDLSIDESSLQLVISGLSRAISQGCRVVWLDHHHWSNSAAKMLLRLDNKPILKVNPDYCAAEITHKVLMPRDEISEELASIAHDTDFNLRELEAATALTDALSVTRFSAIDRQEDVTAALMPLLEKLTEAGISGIWDEDTKQFKDTLLGQRVQHYRKEKDKKMRRALISHQDLKIHDRLVRVVELPSGVTTTDMGTYVVQPENLDIDGHKLQIADLFVTLSQGGMLGFRRGNDTVLCNEAARLFNGGGHPFAAGGEYGMYENFDEACDDIFATLEKEKAWVN